MHNLPAVSLVALLLAVGTAQAADAPSGKIVCWKDKAGKTVGCGDKVPPEYQDGASKELNKRGVTVKQSDPPLTPAQQKELAAEAERKTAANQIAAEQKRKDKALLDTFTTVKEIDLKRNRDIQLIASNIEAQQTNLKNANDRQADSRGRIEQLKKENKPVPAAIQEEYDRAEAGKTKIQAQKRKEIADLNQQYDDMKKRFMELTGTTAAAPAAAVSPAAPATATKPAPAPAPSTAAAKK